jgi:ferredoxin
MAVLITDTCINCDACIDECPTDGCIVWDMSYKVSCPHLRHRDLLEKVYLSL